MAFFKPALMAAAILAGFAGAAHADNISLRVSYAEGRSGTTFMPVHAEVGDFGLTPNLPANDGAPEWRVVAKDASGKVLHEVRVRNGLQRHVEVFNPQSGAIDLAKSVKQAQGVFEVSLPFDAASASVEVMPVSSAKALAKTAPGALVKFERAMLERMVGASKQERMQKAASGVAAPTVTTIFETGPSKTRMDYVFVGDGYTAAEMDKWRADATKVIDGFMADSLFAANRANMNVRRVDVASKQSGVDEIDRGIYRNTAFDGEFGCYNIDRLLCVNETKVYDTLGPVLAPDKRDVIVVIANSTRYGGSGGAVATLSMHAQSTEVALHEIGHTAFKLADEYQYGTCDTSAEPSEGNVSLVNTRNVKWGAKIAADTALPTGLGVYPNGTVGTFAGAHYCLSEKVRPTENSRMRTLGFPWHVVNEDLAKAVFAKYVAGISPTAVQTGTLAAGETVYAPSAAPGYTQGGRGNYKINLTGSADTNFQLSLYKYLANGWVKVAESNRAKSSESINYYGSEGYYYVDVTSASGTGTYNLKYTFPPR